MFCKNCGQEIRNDDIFCTNCGTRVVQAQPQPNSQPKPQPQQQSMPMTLPTPPQPAEDGKKAPKKKKKKSAKGCLVAFIIAVIIIASILIIAIIAGGDNTTNTVNDSNSASEKTTQSNDGKMYKIGDTVTMHTNRGDYSLKITGVRETSERNEFADEKPKKVILIDYEYQNISFDSDVVISNLYFRVYDNDGNVLTVYPAIDTKSPTTIGQGKKATASVAYGIDSDEKSISLDFYDITLESMFNSECSFKLSW